MTEINDYEAHYEGIYDKGEIKWVGEKPPNEMINLMLETLERYRYLFDAQPPSDSIAGQSQDSDDIASSVVDEED